MTSGTRIRWTVWGVCVATLLSSALAWATIPGATTERSRAEILHVCVDVDPRHPHYVVCDDQETSDPGSPYTGSECVAANLAPVCVVDLVDQARVRGRMLLLMDEDSGTPEVVGTGLVLKFRLGGKAHLLAELFDTDKLGNWNPIGMEENILGPIPFTDATGSAYQFLEGNLTPLALSLIALADAHFRSVDVSGTIPVVTSLTEIPKAVDADHGLDVLASATQRRFTVQFARVRP